VDLFDYYSVFYQYDTIRLWSGINHWLHHWCIIVFELPSFEGTAKTVKAWVKRAGIPKHITWHCARHSFAVNLLTSPQRPDIKTVSSTLGHSSLKHTEKYTRVIDELKKKAVEALPDYEIKF
jgi:integrase